MKTTATGGPIEVWRGVFAPSDADSRGRVALAALAAAALEGLAGASAALGMRGAFSPFSSATLVVRQFQARIVLPPAPASPMHMTCGVLELLEAEAVVALSLLDSASEDLVARFLVRVSHASAREGRPFPWPQRTAGEAAALAVAGEPFGPAPAPAVPGDAALAPTGRGVVRPDEGDAFGRMRLDALVGRLAGGLARLGADALDLGELHLDCRAPLVVGDLFELVSSQPTTDHPEAAHWLRDPESGAVLAAARTTWARRGD